MIKFWQSISRPTEASYLQSWSVLSLTVDFSAYVSHVSTNAIPTHIPACTPPVLRTIAQNGSAIDGEMGQKNVKIHKNTTMGSGTKFTSQALDERAYR